jgi:hypothetical protein
VQTTARLRRPLSDKGTPFVRMGSQSRGSVSIET